MWQILAGANVVNEGGKGHGGYVPFMMAAGTPCNRFVDRHALVLFPIPGLVQSGIESGNGRMLPL